LFVVACTTFGTDDPPAADPPPAGEDAGPPPPSVDAGEDALPRDAASPCHATETLRAARDAIMNASGQDLSDQKICNLSVGACLVAFDLVASRGKSIVGLKLELPRSKNTTDCGGSCLPLRGAGRLAIAHMRSDWTNDAFVGARNGSGAKWNAGDFGGSDVSAMPLAVRDVKAPDDVVAIDLPPAKLDPLWSTPSTIALHVRAAAVFQFVIERAKSPVTPVPALTVTYCP
jgi:hypothetical protein